MFVSEEGTITGSVDVSKLDEVNPQSDEAKAQLDALKRDARLGQEQSARDAERLAEVSRAQGPTSQTQEEAAERAREAQQGDRSGDQSDGGQRTEADSDDAEDGSEDQSEDVEALRAEAEQYGVAVDRRWGATRLRSEIDTAKAEQGQG